MSKVVLMRTVAGGWARVTETPNGGKNAPASICGYKVGTCHTFTKGGKSIQNKQLHQAGFQGLAQADMTVWTRQDGCMILAEHSKRTTTFTRVS